MAALETPGEWILRGSSRRTPPCSCSRDARIASRREGRLCLAAPGLLPPSCPGLQNGDTHTPPPSPSLAPTVWLQEWNMTCVPS